MPGRQLDALGDERCEVVLESRLRLRTHDGLHGFAVLEHNHRRDRGDLVVHRGLRVLIHVQLDDVELLTVFRKDLVESGKYKTYADLKGLKFAFASPGSTPLSSLNEVLKKANLKSRMILQVHDELVFDVHESEIEEMKTVVKEAMENAIHLVVPMEVEMKLAGNWLDAH